MLPLCCRAREIPLGEQDPTGLGRRTRPRSQNTEPTPRQDSQPIPQYPLHHPRASLASHLHSPPGEQPACWKLASRCQLLWGHASSGGFRDSVQVTEKPRCLLPGPGPTRANIPNTWGQHRAGHERGLSNLFSHGIIFSSLHFGAEVSQTFLCSQSLRDSVLPISDLPTEHAVRKPD